ncbi:Mitofusin-2 [Porites harrisoni]
MNQIRSFGQSLASVFSETPDSPNETSDLRNETAGSPNETSDTTWGKLETVVQKAKDDREELLKLKENNHKLCETYRDYLRKDLATPDECQSVKNIEEQLQEITGDLERIQKKCSHEVVIEFVGATSSGKSTLINALTREERLPVGFAETTMCVIEVKTIDDEEWSVEVDKKTLSGKKSKESIRALLTAMSQEDFRNERSDLNINERSVVRVGWPKRFSRQLPQNVVLVDSPGYGEDENVDQIVKDSCQKADIIVAVMDSMSPSKAHVTRLVKEVKCQYAFGVFTKWDQAIQESEKAESHEQISLDFLRETNTKKYLQSFNSRDQRATIHDVFFVDSQHVLRQIKVSSFFQL